MIRNDQPPPAEARAGLLRRVLAPARRRPLTLLIVLGMAVHAAIVLPALIGGDAAERFSRPDSPGYVLPAEALAREGRYLDAPGGRPFLRRVPGLSAVLAPFFLLFGDCGAPAAAALFLGLIGVLTAVPIRLAGEEWFGSSAGTAAAALFVFNVTAIANRPLLLTDTLFTFLVAFQLYFFIRFWKRGETAALPASCAAAAAGILVRPINLAWIFPALFIAAVMPDPPPRRRLAAGAAALALFLIIPAPWMLRNASLGAGYVPDANTGAMYHQNGAMLLAEVNGTSYEREKRKILEELEIEFADSSRYPDERSREKFRLRKFAELVRAHPFVWLRQHFSARTLLPDLPSLCEDLGLTRPDRGTLDVLQRRGAAAALRHYFSGNWLLPAALAPLLVPVLVTYLGALLALAAQLRSWRSGYVGLLVFLAFAEYYLFLPGPMTVPRYQLPALPVLTVLAGGAISRMRMFRRSGSGGGESR